ncbi:urea carboxylase [Vararia minispora EC-137]|uniref:Urea carboxylase n=1 Tax=Vararia minispora EC-137 TaxID=1314806 RepID=A0ACB8QAN2_9AGAM|nr:urea carboxylase [Vararia minispora EC-137]
MVPCKLFVANRGEIAARIIRTAHRLGLPTIAVYTPSDTLSPHVSLATESVELSLRAGDSEALPYLDIPGLVSIAQARGATHVHPGYGFLSENAAFARAVRDAGITFLGPSTDIIEKMGLKHEARILAQAAGISVVPSLDPDGLVQDLDVAVSGAAKVGYPVLMKASAGGGGMGMVICNDERELRAQFDPARERAKVLFHNDKIILERYYTNARHIEVQQVFGNGQGDVVHIGERECSLQRRHQKVIEESPSPFLTGHNGMDLCEAAVRLCRSIKYGSIGTVEFLVDESSGEFFFLEMNTRIQVEHSVTEVSRAGLDLVELMILQGVEERSGSFLSSSSEHLIQAHYPISPQSHAVEARVYAENPLEDFRPSPGVLQLVDFGGEPYPEWLRIDTWVSTGTVVTPFFDPLIAKVIVNAPTRAEALARLCRALEGMKILGPPTNMPFLASLLRSPDVVAGRATTRFLSSFSYTPPALTILSPGLSSAIQDIPGRPALLKGIPCSGAMDDRAHAAANVLAGNPPEKEALEVISVKGAEVRIKFWNAALVGIAGGHSGIRVRVNDKIVGGSWVRVVIPPGSVLELSEEARGSSGGLRVYVAVKGGFPDIPLYLGSKSTSLGFGGYQGRNLTTGDQLRISDNNNSLALSSFQLSAGLVPSYPQNWVLHVVCGPQDGPEYVTPAGNNKFYSMSWIVSPNSNRMGIRLAPSDDSDRRAILWARRNGGEGGSHPSNILDNAYARGTLNINGDTPVILGCEGPDMGGYICMCSVARADLWKLGQLHPGCTIRLQRISWASAKNLLDERDRWLGAVQEYMQGSSPRAAPSLMAYAVHEDEAILDSMLRFVTVEGHPAAVFRQAGDSAILVEYGTMKLDFSVRARIHAFESIVESQNVRGIIGFGPCIRSTMCYFDPAVISQKQVLSVLVDAQHKVYSSIMSSMSFPSRRITFPIVLDDRWSRDALERYMRSTRDKAVYLPSNLEYLVKNNGLKTKEEALSKLTGSDWLVFGVGFYLGCPFFIPARFSSCSLIDPRCRLVGQKMNPSRTFTPRGAVGIAGLVAAIYPVESPGGYQLFARTLPVWHTWSRGKNFTDGNPWFLRPFDQLRFVPIAEDDYEELLKDYDAGRYEFKIEPCTFDLSEYEFFIAGIAEEVNEYRARQAEGVAREETRGIPVTSPLSASVWRIKCKPGDEVKTAGDVLIILEAMKTEISVTAGQQNVGRKVRGVCVYEGSAVGAGETLVLLE